jgi:hypothetical protein
MVRLVALSLFALLSVVVSGQVPSFMTSCKIPSAYFKRLNWSSAAKFCAKVRFDTDSWQEAASGSPQFSLKHCARSFCRLASGRPSLRVHVTSVLPRSWKPKLVTSAGSLIWIGLLPRSYCISSPRRVAQLSRRPWARIFHERTKGRSRASQSVSKTLAAYSADSGVCQAMNIVIWSKL